MKRFSYYKPAGYEEPEICHCGHYAYVHGRMRCGGPARSGYSWRGRLNLWIFGARVSITLPCPCKRAWRDGELL